jgi:hypothetical protein
MMALSCSQSTTCDSLIYVVRNRRIMRPMNHTTPAPEAASGRFVLRIEPGLHAALRAAADGAGVSLNEHCRLKLLAPRIHVSGPAHQPVRHLAAVSPRIGAQAGRTAPARRRAQVAKRGQA